jgi:CBS domain-containing protein
LKTLRGAKVRRLPVIDRDGSLVGVLSIDDIVLKAKEHFLRKDISYQDIENTYKAIRGRPALMTSASSNPEGVSVTFK